MRFSVLALLVCAACSSGGGGGGVSPSGQQGLVGNWIYEDSTQTKGLGLVFRSDSTYVIMGLELTSSNSANVEVEDGTYSTSGSMIQLVPQKYSCGSSDPPYSITYQFQGNDLTISYSGGAFSLTPNDSPPASNFAIQTGCFNNGVFTPEPLVSVQ